MAGIALSAIVQEATRLTDEQIAERGPAWAGEMAEMVEREADRLEALYLEGIRPWLDVRRAGERWVEVRLTHGDGLPSMAVQVPVGYLRGLIDRAMSTTHPGAQ